MNVFQIKLLAIIFMVIDHVGLFLFPDVVFLRIIGRLSFPLFAWLIANGAIHTSHASRYIMRLMCVALASQIPYILLYRQIDASFWALNIFFTLSLGLLAIILIKKTRNFIVKTFLVLGISVVAYFLSVNYGAAGVLSIVLFYQFYKRIWMMLLTQCALFLIFYPLTLLFTYPLESLLYPGAIVGFLQPVAVVALLFIAQYNYQEGPKMKGLFYLFYPAHLSLLYLALILFQ